MIARAIEGRRDRARLGEVRGTQAPDKPFIGFYRRPAAVKTFLAYTLKRLKDRLHRPVPTGPGRSDRPDRGDHEARWPRWSRRDTSVAWFERGVGGDRPRAHAVHLIAALETEYAVLTREIEAETLPTLRELGIATVAYGVLSRGLIWCSAAQGLGATGDYRTLLPRFQGDNLAANTKLVDALNAHLRGEKGRPRGATRHCLGPRQRQRCHTAHRCQDPDNRLAEALLPLDLELTAEDSARIDEAFPVSAVAGDRYDKHGMAMVTRLIAACPVSLARGSPWPAAPPERLEHHRRPASAHPGRRRGGAPLPPWAGQDQRRRRRPRVGADSTPAFIATSAVALRTARRPGRRRWLRAGVRTLESIARGRGPAGTGSRSGSCGPLPCQGPQGHRRSRALFDLPGDRRGVSRSVARHLAMLDDHVAGVVADSIAAVEFPQTPTFIGPPAPSSAVRSGSTSPVLPGPSPGAA